jgi:hypothetical protein
MADHAKALAPQLRFDVGHADHPTHAAVAVDDYDQTSPAAGW